MMTNKKYSFPEWECLKCGKVSYADSPCGTDCPYCEGYSVSCRCTCGNRGTNCGQEMQFRKVTHYIVNLTSHAHAKWGTNQKAAIWPSEVIELPEELQVKFSQVDPTKPVKELALEIHQWLINFCVENKLTPGQVDVLIQGEFRLTHTLVNLFKRGEYRCMVATTKREVVETQLPDGSTKKEVRFLFVDFMEYE